MLCQKCKKNQANVHLVKLVNGEKSDVWLCEECARKISDISLGIPMNNTNINSDSFQNILSGFFDSFDKKKEPRKELKMDVVCTNCGMRFSKFKETLEAGCGECYSSFKDLIDEEIKKVQGSTVHIGKIPLNINEEEEKQLSIKQLKEQLNKAIIEEAYERAAVLRDKIKSLKNPSGGVESYEKLDS